MLCGPSYLAPPPFDLLRIDATLRTAGEVVALMLRVEAIVSAPQREVLNTAALDHEPIAVNAEAKWTTMGAEIVGACRPNEGALLWVD